VNSTAVIVAKSGPALGGETATVQLADDGWLNGVNAAQDLIQVGDAIRFNYQGHYYVIFAIDRGARQLAIRAINTTGLVSQPVNVPLPYQVIRQPIPSAGTDLILPEGVVIDLAVSGPEAATAAASVFPPASAVLPLNIVVAPSGAIIGYRAGGGPLTNVQAPLYLLLGKREKVEAAGTADGNERDFENYWIAIHHQSGLVTAAQNAGVGGADPNPLNNARDFARKAISVGGR